MTLHNMRRVIVTGVTGFVGRRLAAHLSARKISWQGWSRASIDMMDRDAVAKAVADFKPDTVFHLAAAGVKNNVAHDPAIIGADIGMTANLLAALNGDVRLVIAGSMSEYGHSGCLNETDGCAPTTAYGIAKLASALYALAYAPGKGVSVTVARLFGVYGPGEDPSRLFPMLTQAMRARQPVPLSDGLQRRDFIHVDDVCRALIAVAGKHTDSIVNVGTGQAVCVRDVALWVAQAAGAPVDLLQFGARPRSPGDQDLLFADVARLTAILGVPPPQRLVTGLDLSLFESNQISNN